MSLPTKIKILEAVVSFTLAVLSIACMVLLAWYFPAKCKIVFLTIVFATLAITGGTIMFFILLFSRKS